MCPKTAANCSASTSSSPSGCASSYSIRRARVLSAGAAALADPTRLRVAAALAEGGELCVCDLAWIVARSDKLVSHHLQALRAAGLAAHRREGKVVYYRLTGAGSALFAAVLAGAGELVP